ncbi:hypothetical protein P2H44_09425 [Albimonas sp. CAU 1670]|uniref:hypothetical protein n=1 Tax=Albimonas sp. CAU 1670 TaxID=3032599 RepID=UPI0023D9BE7C|nr:hypothetical protein [Albimonas sp. CAU 1670]MDF2232772.1 hypothetical protein [Albimonas sp. CAU 1670]
MKIRSLIAAGVAAGALLAPVAAPAVQSIAIPASGPAGAEVIQVAGKKAEETRRKAGAKKKKQRQAGGKARKGDGKRHAGGKSERKAGQRKTAEAGGRKAKRDDSAAAWRERHRDDDRREARRKDDRREARRDDDRRKNKDLRKDRSDDGRRLTAAEAWRAKHRDDRHAWADWRDDARWREDRRLAARHADFGWREDRDDRRWRDAWRAQERERARLLFAPARTERWSGWNEPRQVRVLPASGPAWARPGGARLSVASLIAPAFGWRPTPVTTLFGVGAPAYAYPYGWDARPVRYAPVRYDPVRYGSVRYAEPRRTTLVRVVDPYRSGPYRSAYPTPYSTWRPDGYAFGYDAWGANSLFGDLSVPLAALLLAAYL